MCSACCCCNNSLNPTLNTQRSPITESSFCNGLHTRAKTVLILHLKSYMVGFIYTFWCSLSSTSSILEQRLQSVHHLQMTSSEGFQHHFTIISKFVCFGCYMNKNVAFTLISFAVYHFNCHSSFGARSKITTYIVQNVIELGFLLSRMQMKLTSIYSRELLL